MQGKLYLVATPIGNLEDITFRAIKTLKEVDLIAAEDTRHTLKLLNYYEISKPLISYHRHNEEIKKDLLINKLLEGNNIAIVTDAGTPGISDPGEEIVKEAIANNIQIIPIPGACALINALIPSGLNTKEFSFFGFLPLNKKNREEAFDKIKKERKTVILYEAPHKLTKTLEDILKNLGNIKCVLAKEITKIHEEFIRGNILELLEVVKEPKGEYVIMLDLENFKDSKDNDLNEEIKEKTIEEQYRIYEAQGLNKKDIIKQIAKNKNVPKNEIYKMFIK
jgi:16S rRNA (cytidine1402-2'-O)-methyltransferase